MFLDQLTEKEMEKVEAIGERRLYKAGDIVIKEGDSGTSFSLILRGQVQVKKRLAVGQHRVLVDLGPCDLIGELGFLGAESRSATIVALTDCEILEFQRTAFEELVARKPAIGAKVYRGMAEVLAARLASDDETLMDTLFWALGRSLNKTPTVDISIENRPKMTLKKI